MLTSISNIKHKRLSTAFLLISSAIIFSQPLFAQNREQLRVVGSSTVYPFTTVVAENFSKKGNKAPIIESTGTGGGFKLFCEGVGNKFPDATNASRQIKLSEFNLCHANGVKQIIELKIGYDGLTLGLAKSATPINLTRRHIFLALAKNIPDSAGNLIANPHKTWADIDASLPDRKIEVLGPPPTSGTRDSLVELILEKGAETFPSLLELKKKDAKAFDAVWKSVREDGAFIEAGENDNLIVQKIEANPNAFGVFGFSFLEENKNKIQATSIEGVTPNFDTISSGKYTVSRPLYVYFKGEHIPLLKAITPFMQEFVSNKAIGLDGYLEAKGLIPLPESELKLMQSHISLNKPLTKEGLN